MLIIFDIVTDDWLKYVYEVTDFLVLVLPAALERNENNNQ
jgi:hypothetical protein